ncbi:MAG: UTP-hexose-phosphate uridylyltransferase [Herbinix sp.]|nr:UTP-hexose-phosphate uridylyltransferase [Herbinix sp.]
MIYELIKKLVLYGEMTGLVEADDVIYTTNRLLELFQLEEYQDTVSNTTLLDLDENSLGENNLEGNSLNGISVEGNNLEENYLDENNLKGISVEGNNLEENSLDGNNLNEFNLEGILGALMEYAYKQGIMKEDSIVYRDLFDTKIMGLLVPTPSSVTKKFKELYAKSPKEATEYYYKFSQATDYIRRYRIQKDIKWITNTIYGDIDITINLSKPEKDPKAIAAAKLAKQSGYPKCLLCKENVGYAGRVDHPARQNHRVIPITINNQAWGFQYSPYVYYNEHCIVFNNEHIPMQIDKAAFRKLLDFVIQFPHYFVGSNADLPIVGGSILSHDHFQGGNYNFPMAKARVERNFTITGFEDVEVGVVTWPMSVLRIRCIDDHRLVELADKILKKWRGYTDKAAGVFAETGTEPHNTITPIARKREDLYELDLVLRNNLTTDEHPFGVFHPHTELHHIKKENIGLIEVMGLAVLPSRLKEELELLKEYILEGKDLRTHELLEKHAVWVEEFLPLYKSVTKDNIDDIIKDEIGKVFLLVLEHAGVYKRTQQGQEAFDRFIDTLG